MTATFTAQLFAPVEQKWIIQALEEFRLGKSKIYFGTDSTSFSAKGPSIKTVLFKIKGKPYVTATANFIDMTDSPPSAEERLDGQASKSYRSYYSFDHLTLLSEPIPLSSLRHYKSGKPVRDDAPGCYIVKS